MTCISNNFLRPHSVPTTTLPMVISPPNCFHASSYKKASTASGKPGAQMHKLEKVPRELLAARVVQDTCLKTRDLQDLCTEQYALGWPLLRCLLDSAQHICFKCGFAMD
eukprot:2420513-Lingulodinium_polyedra.AAC.1